MKIPNLDGERCLTYTFTVCPNPECKKFSLVVQLSTVAHPEGFTIPRDELRAWQLVPPSAAKRFPDYIPAPILNDYEEACLIKDLSPRASSTLARRCLQGMIRDFWKVNAPNLKQEIEAIKDKVEPLTWEAIDAVRSVGNVGAHMEKDINVILDVDTDEANLLIGLIEHLLKDWYIARADRKSNLLAIADLGKKKPKIAKAKEAGVDDPATGKQ